MSPLIRSAVIATVICWLLAVGCWLLAVGCWCWYFFPIFTSTSTRQHHHHSITILSGHISITRFLLGICENKLPCEYIEAGGGFGARSTYLQLVIVTVRSAETFDQKINWRAVYLHVVVDPWVENYLQYLSVVLESSSETGWGECPVVQRARIT